MRPRVSLKRNVAKSQFFFCAANHRLENCKAVSAITWDCVGAMPLRRSPSAVHWAIGEELAAPSAKGAAMLAGSRNDVSSPPKIAPTTTISIDFIFHSPRPSSVVGRRKIAHDTIQKQGIQKSSEPLRDGGS